MARTRRKRRKLLSRGSALCVRQREAMRLAARNESKAAEVASEAKSAGGKDLKCQILKPTNNTLKANIRKHQCQKNSRISREYFAEAEMAIQFDTDTQALSQDTCCSADRNFHHSCSIVLSCRNFSTETMFVLM